MEGFSLDDYKKCEWVVLVLIFTSLNESQIATNIDPQLISS